VKPQLKLSIRGNVKGLDPENQAREERSYELAEKVFELIVTNSTVGHGARALDLVVQAMSQHCQDFTDAFIKSNELTHLGLKTGRIEFHVTAGGEQ
jgi:hypothetical protein